MKNERFELQQMMENCQRSGKVLAVTSGKGDIGKTNIAANLAICMAVSGKKVLLIDGDISLGNLDVIMNINSKYNISHMLNGAKSIEEIIDIGPAGVEIICGGSGLENLADLNEFQRQRLIRDFTKLQEDFDVIIIDTAGGISKSVVGFCIASDHILVVTTPEAAAMTDAYAMIKVLVGNKVAGGISLVVNMADTTAEGKKTYRQIVNVAKRFLNIHVYDAGILLRDERLISAVRQRKPVVLAYPRARITSSLAALAAKLSNISTAVPGNGRFFKKVIDWFF